MEIFKTDGIPASDFDQHIAVLDFQKIHRDSCAGTVSGLARLGIPGPGVPGADNLPVLDRALAQRPATMQADVVHGAISAVYVRDANLFASTGEFFGFIGAGKVGFGG